MNPFLHDWNFECDLPLGPNHELMELMYRNGQVVAQSQTHQRPSPGPTRLDPTRKLQKQQQQQQQQFDGSYVDSDILEPDTAASWIEHPVQDSFKEFSSHFLMLHDPMETDKPTKQFEEVVPQQPNKPKHCFDPKSPMPPPPRIQLDSSHSFGKVANFTQFSAPTKLGGQVSGDRSVMTVGSSHGSNNLVVNGPGFTRATSSNGLGYGSQFFGNKEVPKTVLHKEGRKQETMEPTLTSSSGRTESSFGGMNKNSAGADSLKRKGRDVEDSECLSEAAELESAGGKKSVQQSGSARKSRAAEVHNQSERRRRDRINKKMRALQELIPHCNKTDKASMLDEAIEYLKALQMQLQVMWMGGGMAPMMFPGMQHYMSPMGMGLARHSLSNGMNFPGVSIVGQSVNMAASASNPSMMCQTPILNPVNLQNQMQTHSFPEQFARYMGMHQMQSATTSQPMNMFGFGPQSIHPTQVNVSGPPSSSIDALGGNKMG